MIDCVKSAKIIQILALLISLALCSTDYYELLGVARDADDRTLRRAFKKLAMTLHPDKNQEDPKAHDKFVEINRAYEVLKDETMRKKYDLHGEEGLKDGATGHNYQSWQFYRDNFGIYDEDSDIITLNRADFEQSVTGGSDMWFVNFYSPQCSHCHDLAPTWRQMASSLEGVIRIGAVNCGDEWMLCRQMSVWGYPSLVFYPTGEVYEGSREHDDLIKFVLDRVKGQVIQLNTKNADAFSTEWSKYSSKPWLVDFCPGHDTDSCLEMISRRKIAAILHGLVNVATIDCKDGKEALCEKLQRSEGVAFYPAGKLDKSQEKVLDSLDAKELATDALKLLPDMREIDHSDFQKIEERILTGKEMPWLVQFVFAKDHRTGSDLDLRKLPALLADDGIRLGRLNCSNPGTVPICENLHIASPTFALFKPSGGFEIHYGRTSAHDIATFARQAKTSNVRSVSIDDFDKLVLNQKDLTWFLDFFAPWCPPCMRLLPEFRKAAKMVVKMDPGARFGTVDCTVHTALCQRVGVNTYPTTIIYNNSEPNTFVGLHGVDELVEFYDDIKHPSVLELSQDSFSSLIKKRKSDSVIAVDFFAPWCGHCQEMAPHWRKLAKYFKKNGRVTIASVDCTLQAGLCASEAVNSFPTIRLYGDNVVNHQGWYRDFESLRQWIMIHLPSKTVHLQRAEEFHKILASDEIWLLDFYAPWCGPCNAFAPEFDVVAETLLPLGVKSAKVNCDSPPTQAICKQAIVRAYPSVRLYLKSENENSRDASGLDIQSQNARQIVEIVKNQLELQRNQHGRNREEL